MECILRAETTVASRKITQALVSSRIYPNMKTMYKFISFDNKMKKRFLIIVL